MLIDAGQDTLQERPGTDRWFFWAGSELVWVLIAFFDQSGRE